MRVVRVRREVTEVLNAFAHVRSTRSGFTRACACECACECAECACASAHACECAIACACA